MATQSKKTERKKLGRPRKNIDWKKVEDGLKAGCTITSIAKSLGLDRDTIHRRYEQEFNEPFEVYSQDKKATGEIEIQIAQHEKALKGDSQMLIFLGKVRLKQNDKAVESDNTVNLADLSKHEFDEIVKDMVQE